MFPVKVCIDGVVLKSTAFVSVSGVGGTFLLHPGPLALHCTAALCLRLRVCASRHCSSRCSGTTGGLGVDDLERFKFQLKCWGGWEFYILATHERWGCLGCGPRDHSLRLLRNNTGLRVVGVRTCSTWSQGTQEWKTWCILRKHQLIEDMLMKD